MSTPNPSPVFTNLEQQHKLAKDLLRAARDGDPAALARIRAARGDAGTPARPLTLADAQLALAREGGFDSWPRLVAELQERDVKAFADAVRAGDRHRTQQLLALPHVRARINDPMFDFGQRAAHIAAKNEPLLTALLDAGADVNLKSDWENGPYTVLDNADEPTARFLLTRGATLTPNVAARLGWFDELQALVNADGALVHARGGDGQQPLHAAKTVAIADFLLDRGAGIDVRCIDHKTTPAQYALVDRPDVCRRLLERGATPDIFMAACLGDVALATRLVNADPACLAARINEPGYAPVPPLHIYCWTIGFGLSPHDAALKFGHRDVHALFMARSPARIQLMQALLAGKRARGPGAARGPSVAARVDDAAGARAPGASDLPRALSGRGADAAPRVRPRRAGRGRRVGAARRLLGGQRADGGAAASSAAASHSTPGIPRIRARRSAGPRSDRCTAARRGADYPAVVDRLVAAGADITAVGNKDGLSLLSMAQGNAAMQEALRRLGAT